MSGEKRIPVKATVLKTLFFLTVAMVLPVLSGNPACAQQDGRMVRMAKLVIDPAQLEAYKAALREEIGASLRLEPGVKRLDAVAEKDHPERLTILEVYASHNAYEAHLKTPHFTKYKDKTKDMIQSLELIESVPLMPVIQ